MSRQPMTQPEWSPCIAPTAAALAAATCTDLSISPMADFLCLQAVLLVVAAHDQE